MQPKSSGSLVAEDKEENLLDSKMNQVIFNFRLFFSTTLSIVRSTVMIYERLYNFTVTLCYATCYYVSWKLSRLSAVLPRM